MGNRRMLLISAVIIHGGIVTASTIGVNASIQANGQMVQSCNSGVQCDISYKYLDPTGVFNLNYSRVQATAVTTADGLTLSTALTAGDTGLGSVRGHTIVNAEWDGMLTFAGNGNGMADVHVEISSQGNTFFNSDGPMYYYYSLNGANWQNRGLMAGSTLTTDTVSIPVIFGVPTPISLIFRFDGHYIDTGANQYPMGVNRDLSVRVLEADQPMQSDIPTIPNPEPSTMVISLFAISLLIVWRRIK
jgi:hypothetical protein